MDGVIRIAPLEFVHILDLNSNITFVEVGPQTRILLKSEKIAAGPLPFVKVPPGHYCRVADPLSERIYDKSKPVKLKHGQYDIRFNGDPFFLIPGESLVGAEDFLKSGSYRKAIQALPVAKVEQAIRLRALYSHEDNGTFREADDMWQIKGPVSYLPTPHAEVAAIVNAEIVEPGKALKLQAIQDTVDYKGNKRVTGEQWLIKEEGAYIPGVYEKFQGYENEIILQEDTAAKVCALVNLTDSLGKKRLAGDEWIITRDDTPSFIPEIGMEVKKTGKEENFEKG